MSIFSTVSVAAVALWAALVVTAQVLTPEQSPLSMGMSGLSTGRHGWAMKAAFVIRGVSALALLAALPAAFPAGQRPLAGFALFWVWGAGSMLLAVFDTDMPGEPPTRDGRLHIWIALVAYVGAIAGMVVLSLALRQDVSTAGLGRWALPIALVAAVAMVLQFVAFGQAAREAGPKAAAAAGPHASSSGRSVSAFTSAASGASPAASASAAPAPVRATSLLAATHVAPAAPASEWSAALGLYAGLLQRVFVGLVMAWTVFVAIGI